MQVMEQQQSSAVNALCSTFFGGCTVILHPLQLLWTAQRSTAFVKNCAAGAAVGQCWMHAQWAVGGPQKVQ